MVTMRAVIQDRYGPPDVLREVTVDRPMAGPSAILVRVTAASVNGYDVLLRSGALKMVAGRKFPKRSGLDFVGVIADAPPDSGFEVDDAVWGVMPLHEVGALADYVAIDTRHLSRRPPGLSATDAAALPVVGTTALAALRDVANLQKGERLLIRGASGGVGAVAVQLGRTLGAHVTGLASGRNLAFVRDLGADEAIDYMNLDPKTLGRFDVILDAVGTDVAAYRRLLAKDGRMVAIVPSPKHPLLWMAYVAWSRVHGRRRVRYFNAEPDTALLEALVEHVEEGDVRPHVEGVYPIARVADAHRAFEARGSRGKQVVSLD